MRDHTMRKAPDAFLGISHEKGEIRRSVTTAHSSIKTVPRVSGQRAADAFGQDEGEDQGFQQNPTGSDVKVATRLYVEIAEGNDSARTTFFPTLIGCAVAYTCFGLPMEGKVALG